jgi:putative ABC transport system permease protein
MLTATIDQLKRDVRYAGRLLRSSPTFLVVATLTLALGVGANATIFSIVDAVVRRPLPFAEAERLVNIVSTRGPMTVGTPSPLDARDVGRESRTLQDVTPYDEWRKNVSVSGDGTDAQEMAVGLVSRDYFNALRVTPIVGRLFSDEEMRRGNHYVAAISRELWQSAFGGARDVLGRPVWINAERYTVIAVVPDVDLAFLNPRGLRARVWTPWALEDIQRSDSSRGPRGAYAIARLRAGSTLDQAKTEVAQIGARLASTYVADRLYGLSVESLVDARSGPLRSILVILGGGVALVLLIACANLLGLIQARNAVREREMLVRTALGASRAQIARQLVVETILIGIIGGTIGCALAAVGCAAVTRWHPAQFPQLATLGVNASVLAFGLLVAVGVPGIFGLWPAWRTARVDVATSLRAGGRTGTASREQRRTRSMLVVIEVALAVMLVATTAVLTESVAHLRHQDLGFSVDGLLKAHIYIPPVRHGGPEALTQFSERLVTELRALPGARFATVATGFPPVNARWQQAVTVSGEALARSDDRSSADLATVDEQYLRTLGGTLVRGRDLAQSDVAAGAAVAIVNEAFVSRLITTGDVIGREIQLGNPLIPVATPRAITIVGVFRNMKNDGLAKPVVPQVVALTRQLPGFNSEFKDLIIRSNGDPAQLVVPVRRIIEKLDPDIPLAEVATMQDVVAAASGGTAYATILLGVFAALGLGLAAVGIYGVVAYTVAQRAGEIGIRSALGATGADIFRLVVGHGLVLGVVGSVLGLIGAISVSDIVASEIYGVSATDPIALTATVFGLLVVTILASAVPAWRATRIDPASALQRS